MRINWVFANGYRLDPGVNIEKVKDLGSTWGGWPTWHTCGTDNVICHSQDKAQELLAYGFHTRCNFYIPKKCYQELGNPPGVNQYQGEFEHDVDQAEDIVALHFVSAVSDLVLLAGFDFGKITALPDKSEHIKRQNYHRLIQTVMISSSVEWIAVDHPTDFDILYQGLPNLTCDTMENVLQLLEY